MKKVGSILIVLFILLSVILLIINHEKVYKPGKKPITTIKELTPYDKYNAQKVNLENKVISSTFVDYDNDGKKEEIKIILDKGYFHKDDEEWSGNGPKWVGNYSIHVYKEQKDIFNTSLNKLINPKTNDDIFFYSPEFQLIFYDYNLDEKLDFVLSQYYSTNGCVYYLFSLDDTGKIFKLEIDGRYAFFISPMSKENSIILPFKDGKIITSYYANIEGVYYTDYYVWNVEKKKFTLDKHINGAN